MKGTCDKKETRKQVMISMKYKTYDILELMICGLFFSK